MPNKVLKGQWDAAAISAIILLALSVLLGGASQQHALRLAIVELAALPVLVIGTGRLIRSGQWHQHRFALGLLACLAALPLIQLIPLPPAVWTGLPGRGEMVLALQLAGIQPGWAPLSVTPVSGSRPGRSRAGVILFGPAALASLLAAWVAAGRGRPGPGLVALTGAAAAAVGAVALFALPPILARFDIQSAPEGRFEAWPIVAGAADSWLPLGAGMGSFDTVYRSVEPLAQLDPSFFNHAHNEYLETWLEAGWPGMALIIGFFIWYGRRLWTAWRAGPSRERDLQRAASIGLLMMLVHSAVDYPLRTATLACLFALCAAILEKAGHPTERERT